MLKVEIEGRLTLQYSVRKTETYILLIPIRSYQAAKNTHLQKTVGGEDFSQ
jgi:hypothetical protein